MGGVAPHSGHTGFNVSCRLPLVLGTLFIYALTFYYDAQKIFIDVVGLILVMEDMPENKEIDLQAEPVHLHATHTHLTALRLWMLSSLSVYSTGRVHWAVRALKGPIFDDAASGCVRARGWVGGCVRAKGCHGCKQSTLTRRKSGSSSSATVVPTTRT